MKHRRFGLIGYPIAHSLSPALFKAGYDGRYPYELIETEDFEEAYKLFLEGYDGINVTAPFKELAFGKADILSEECKVIKAANLLVKTPEGIKAFNSDFLGIRLWLEEIIGELSGNMTGSNRIPPTSCRPHPATMNETHFSPSVFPGGQPKTLVVGLGGAGKAAAAAAWSTGCRLTLMNRDIAKAEDMAAHLDKVGGGNRDRIEVRPLEDFLTCFDEADIIIYNLPVRLPVLDALTKNHPETSYISESSRCKTRHLLEANYRNPSFDTGLMNVMESIFPGLRYTDGTTWLLLQAVTGYELFTGEKPDLSRMSAQI